MVDRHQGGIVSVVAHRRALSAVGQRKVDSLIFNLPNTSPADMETDITQFC